jgi:hypothetical protein
MKKLVIATTLQIVGASLGAVGLGMVWLPLGIISAGVFLVLFGLALERDNA